MSANLKCYDPATGGVLFDLQGHTTRFLGVIGMGLTEGLIDVETGGGVLFWALAGGGAWIYSSQGATGAYMLASHSNDDIAITLSASRIVYKKPSHIVIIYGVYV